MRENAPYLIVLGSERTTDLLSDPDIEDQTSRTERHAHIVVQNHELSTSVRLAFLPLSVTNALEVDLNSTESAGVSSG